MPAEDPKSAIPPSASPGNSSLAQQVVSVVSKRQSRTEDGARQFIIDHIVRAVITKAEFDSSRMLDNLRGYRLTIDAIIDIYVPASARVLGQMWQDSHLDFATVTIGSMRLQSLLSVAAAEASSHFRQENEEVQTLIVVPLGEQHSLGSFVLSAQLRRLGARTELSFCELQGDVMERILAQTLDAVLFTASDRAALETIRETVLHTHKIMQNPPTFILGGCFAMSDTAAKEMTGVDLVTIKADEAMRHASEAKRSMTRGVR